jgi:hypothetical protein
LGHWKHSLLDNDKHDTRILSFSHHFWLSLILFTFRTVLFEVVLAWGWDLHDMIWYGITLGYSEVEI